jgi:hypothetical protein
VTKRDAASKIAEPVMMSANVMAWMAASKIAEPVVISVDDVCQCDAMDGIARPPEPADRTSTVGQ